GRRASSALPIGRTASKRAWRPRRCRPSIFPSAGRGWGGEKSRGGGPPRRRDCAGDVLFLDLDVVITGSLDEFFAFEPGRYCVARNWSEPDLRVGNTSVYRFPVGRMTYIFDAFNRDGERFLARYRNSQKYISGEARDMVFWPAEWCLSFKHSLLPR